MSLSVKSILRDTHDFDACCLQKVQLLKPCKTDKPDAAPTVEVHLRPHPRRKAICSGCRQPAPGYDTLPLRHWHYLHLLHCLVILYYAPRRVNCRRCGVKVEWMKWSAGKSPYAVPLMHVLARWARRLSWKEVAGIFQVSW